jgi:hypothetical protein
MGLGHHTHHHHLSALEGKLGKDEMTKELSKCLDSGSAHDQEKCVHDVIGKNDGGSDKDSKKTAKETYKKLKDAAKDSEKKAKKASKVEKAEKELAKTEKA